MSTEPDLHYRRTFVVQASVEHAFEEFTRPIGGWWPRDHSHRDDQVLVGFEGKVGGKWFDLCFDGMKIDRGTILAWEPPHRLMLAWPLTVDPDSGLETSELEVCFVPHLPGSARVDLEHRNMQRADDVDIVKRAFFAPYGWDLLVYNFQAYLASEPWPHAHRIRS